MGAGGSAPRDEVTLTAEEPGADGGEGSFSESLRTNLQRLFLYASSSDVTVQREVAERLANEAVLKARQEQIVQFGGLTLLVPLAQSRDVEVQRLATHALANLSALPANQLAIAEVPGGLEVLGVLLSSGHAEVQRQAAKTVANISVVPATMQAMAAKGCLPPLLAMLSSPHPRTRVEAIAAVSNLAVNDANEQALVRGGAFEKLLAVLGASPSAFQPPADLDTATQLARALRNLTSNVGHARQLLALGGREALACLESLRSERVTQQCKVCAEHLQAALAAPGAQ
jgi:hypothetical protein